MCSGISISRSAMDCRNVDYCRWEMKIKMKMKIERKKRKENLSYFVFSGGFFVGLKLIQSIP